MKVALAIALFTVTAFCGFGYLATFEPMDGDVLSWRIVYGTGFLACGFGGVRVLRLARGA